MAINKPAAHNRIAWNPAQRPPTKICPQQHESVVVNGEWSHVHEHTYLLWWDAAGNACFETTKPPSAASWQQAVNGVGVQALQVAGGKVQEATLGTESDRILESRSMIGIDPARKILWLIAFENASLRHAAEVTARLGVPSAGQLDSGSATTMIVGPACSPATSRSAEPRRSEVGHWSVGRIRLGPPTCPQRGEM